MRSDFETESVPAAQSSNCRGSKYFLFCRSIPFFYGYSHGFECNEMEIWSSMSWKFPGNYAMKMSLLYFRLAQTKIVMFIKNENCHINQKWNGVSVMKTLSADLSLAFESCSAPRWHGIIVDTVFFFKRSKGIHQNVNVVGLQHKNSIELSPLQLTLLLYTICGSKKT